MSSDIGGIGSTVFRPPSVAARGEAAIARSAGQRDKCGFGIAQATTTNSVFAPMQLERKVLLALLPPLVVACFMAWASGVMLGNTTIVEEYQLLPMTILFAFLFLWALRSRANEIWKIRAITLVMVCATATERQALGLWYTAVDGYDPAILRNMLPWNILASLLCIFLIPGKRGVYAALANYTVNALAVAAFLVLNSHPFDPSMAADLALTYFVTHLAIIGMTVVFSRLRVAYGKALARAEDLEVLALEDALTGILNRRAFSLAFKRARARHLRNQTPMSVMLLDIDHFKQINDTLGHDVGDHALRALAGLLVSDLRRTDEVFRCGGEEFLILLEETSLQSAWEIAERLRKRIERSNLIHDRVVTVSVGVAELSPHESEVDIFKRADIALYEAKAHGRNHVCIAHPPQVDADLELP